VRRLPWALWLLTVLVIGFSFYLWSGEDSPFALGFLASATIGAFVASRQPETRSAGSSASSLWAEA
jgi:hypothetical protein